MMRVVTLFAAIDIGAPVVREVGASMCLAVVRWDGGTRRRYGRWLKAQRRRRDAVDLANEVF
jgi:hypothetical protein